MNIRRQVEDWAGLVKFSHTVFALPFALSMVAVVARGRGVTVSEVVLVLLCVASARTAAMAFNRWADAQIDAKNPRTSTREIPAGKISRTAALLLTITASVVFLFGSALLGLHCLPLAVPVLGILLGYSYLKRFSALCHVVLGVALALAPGGVWYALTATWSWKPVSLMGAVLLWVAGFDILYSCQDIEFDRANRLHSVPSFFGERGSIILAALFHSASLPLLVIFGQSFDLGPIYFSGVAVFALVIATQYIAIARQGITCIDQVFFTRNGLASGLFFLFVLASTLFDQTAVS